MEKKTEPEHGVIVCPDKDSKNTVVISNDSLTLDKPAVVVPSSAYSRKRKANHERAAECCSAPTKRRFESRLLLDELELAEGRFLCWCSEWIPVESSLENLRKHLLNCPHSISRGIFSLDDIFKANDNDLKHEFLASAHVSNEKEGMQGKITPNAGVHYDTSREQSQSSVSGCRDVEENHDIGYDADIPYAIRTKRPNRTEEERLREFLDDPQVKEVTPYQVLCRSCGRWIKLRNNSRYCSIPWQCHKSSCKRKTTPKESTNATSIADAPKNVPSSREKAMNSDLSSPSLNTNVEVPPRNTHPSLRIHSTEQSSSSTSDLSPRIGQSRSAHAEKRKTILEADPNAEVVEPYRVLCALCKKWVKLRPNSIFCSAPWKSHIRRCLVRSAKKSSKASNAKEERSGNKSTHLGGNSATVPVAPKRRGRPRKNPVPQTPINDSTESDISYESEEPE